jgi:hypothetical protein
MMKSRSAVEVVGIHKIFRGIGTRTQNGSSDLVTGLRSLQSSTNVIGRLGQRGLATTTGGGGSSMVIDCHTHMLVIHCSIRREE